MTSTDSGVQLSDLEQAVARYIERERLLPPKARVSVAVSGGSDSVALLHVLLGLARAGAGYQLSVAHLNHLLRPGDAERDEAFVRRLAESLSLPYLSEARDVRAIARERRLNLEAAARAVRYEFLEQAARRLGAQFVATGHTRDDQLETILWRLHRSDDLHGLAGVPVSRPIREGSSIVLVRPLLEVSRQALQDYLSARQVPWQTDHTNRDLARTRNLIRHRLLPIVRNRLGEGYLQDLLDFAARVGQVDRRGRELIEHQLASHAERSERGLALPVDWLRSLPEHFRYAVLYRALRQAELELAPPGRFLDSTLTHAHVRAVARAVEAGGPVLVDQLPGDLVAERTDSELFIGRRIAKPSAPSVAPRPLPVDDGAMEVPELGLRVAVRLLDRSRLDWESWLRRKQPGEEMLDADAVGPRKGLVLRTRRPGDRIEPLGAPGEKTLKKFLIDRKVPRPQRDRTLLLARGNEVLWVVGLAISDHVKVTPPTRHVLHLRSKSCPNETK